MKFELTQAQKQKYKEEGMVVLEDIFPPELHAHLALSSNGTNQFQTNLEQEKLLTFRGLGEILHQLSQTRPIRLIYSEVLEKRHIDFRELPFQGLLIAIVIPLNENRTTIIATNSDYVVSERSIVAVYGESNALLVKGKHNQDLFKLYTRNGYGSGDRLKSSDSPFVYR